MDKTFTNPRSAAGGIYRHEIEGQHAAADARQAAQVAQVRLHQRLHVQVLHLQHHRGAPAPPHRLRNAARQLRYMHLRDWGFTLSVKLQRQVTASDTQFGLLCGVHPRTRLRGKVLDDREVLFTNGQVGSNCRSAPHYGS